jgi:hypothetical protein
MGGIVGNGGIPEIETL